MRLSTLEIKAIKQIFNKIFKFGDIYLFGSRVDDSQKGGDIDLYIDAHGTQNKLEKKLKFLTLLKQEIGDQKIDIIISKDKTRVIEQEAMKYGVKL
jgi:predicted nucleotidyltransferase